MRPRAMFGRTFLLAIALAISGAVIWTVGRNVYWSLRPTEAYRSITGRELPAGVDVLRYVRQGNDNFLHTTHCWLLVGSPGGLREIIRDSGLKPTEDAASILPDTERIFGYTLASSEVFAAFEWELDRDRWYYILVGETNAIYTH